VDAERFIRKRFTRLALALLLVAMAGWALLPHVTNRIAASAFVNAELVRVTAPFAGRLAEVLPRHGVLLDEAVSLKLIEALSPDRRHLLDLERQLALAEESRQLARRQLLELSTFDVELGQRTETYRLRMVDRINHEVSEAEAEKAGCLAEFRQRRDIGSRIETLTKSGLLSEIRSAEALVVQEQASTRCRVAGERIDRIKIELEAARNGVFLRDGANDVPYSQQQRDRLALRRQELEMLALQESTRSLQLAAEIAAERDRIDRLDSYRVAVPAGHVVWSMAASPGSAVTEGQTIFDLADCEHRFVAVELPERDFEQIKKGETAAVRLIGSNEWQQGRVQQIRGSAARPDNRLFAAQTPAANPGTITVEVSLPADQTRPDGANFCSIGRLAEVRFRRSLFDLAALANGWRRLMGSVDAPRAPNITSRSDFAGALRGSLDATTAPDGAEGG
jgi:multidrug resistance efflux pump